jgi:hypothetical protein
MVRRHEAHGESMTAERCVRRINRKGTSQIDEALRFMCGFSSRAKCALFARPFKRKFILESLEPRGKDTGKMFLAGLNFSLSICRGGLRGGVG